MRFKRLSPPDASAAATWRHRLLLGLVLLVAVAGAIALGNQLVSDNGPPARPPQPATNVLEIVAGAQLLVRVRMRRDQPADRVALALLLTARLARGTVAAEGRARITYEYDVEATVRRALRRGAEGGRIQAVREPVSSRIRAPLVRQARRNSGEAAALEVLLASTGTRVSQRQLQAAFPRTRPLDPVGEGPRRVWGDPDLGYVGRADGGDVAGRFGIYPEPVAATARRYGRRLEDLSASTAERIYAILLAGRAVMAWIAPSRGPYGTWRSPQNKQIQVNLGVRTIVLTGITRDGDLRVVNPSRGTLDRWSPQRFEKAWQLLDRRALGRPA